MPLRTLALVSLLFGAMPVFAQAPVTEERDFVFFNHAVPNPFTGLEVVPDEMLQKVQAALGLSETQVIAVKALLNMRSQNNQEILREAQTAQTKLNDITNQSNPNPTELGTAFLAVQGVQKQFRAAAEKFQTDVQALLSADQRSRLASLKTASGQIDALQFLGILDTARGPIGVPFSKIGPLLGSVDDATMTAPAVGGAIRIQRRGPNVP